MIKHEWKEFEAKEITWPQRRSVKKCAGCNWQKHVQTFPSWFRHRTFQSFETSDHCDSAAWTQRTRTQPFNLFQGLDITMTNNGDCNGKVQMTLPCCHRCVLYIGVYSSLKVCRKNQSDIKSTMHLPRTWFSNSFTISFSFLLLRSAMFTTKINHADYPERQEGFAERCRNTLQSVHEKTLAW